MARRKKRGAQLAEFGPALWIFLIFIVFPCLDLLSFVWGVGTVMLVANFGSRQAAACETFSKAIASVNKTEDDMANFRSFAKMTPSGGAPRGVAIRVLRTATDPSSSDQQSYDPPPAPNKIPNSSQDLADNIFQYQVTASYDVQPLFNFSGVPLLSSIPGLGKPVPVSFTQNAQVEHPDGLND